MELKFRPDGKFRIMQIADIQDTQITSKDTVELIEAALDKDKPDLVVFTGDQIKGYGFTLSLGNREENFKKAFDNFLKPVVDRNIPFTFCFGNHDAQAFGISKEKQLALYKSYPNCVAERGDESLDGVANHNLLIKDSKGEKDIFNIYLIDSLSSTPDGRCAAVTKGQIEWYQKTRDELKEKHGDYVKSLVFQHIPMCEMWELFKEVPKSHKPHAQGFREHAGKYYWIDENRLIKGNCDFTYETPATPSENTGEFDALSEKGDVIAAFCGHDHNNSFVGEYNGLIMGYTQGCGFNVYGPKLERGVRIIDLDENNLNTFSTYTTMYKDIKSVKDIHNKVKYLIYSYAPPSVESVIPKLKKAGIIIAVLLLILLAFFGIKNSKPYKRFMASLQIKEIISSAEYQHIINTPLKEYDGEGINFDDSCKTITLENIRLKIPADCELVSNTDATDSITVYTTSNGDNFLGVLIKPDTDINVFINSDEEKAFFDKVKDTCIEEFGFSLDDIYSREKAFWMVNSLADIDYSNAEEVALYYTLLFTKAVSLNDSFSKCYEIETSDYYGFVAVNEYSERISYELIFYPKDNLNERKSVLITIKNRDVNDVYKVINSVELVK